MSTNSLRREDVNLDKLKEAAEKATHELACNDEKWAYVTDIVAAALEAGDEDRSEPSTGNYWDFIAAAGPTTILALIELLEATENGLAYWEGIKADNSKLTTRLKAADALLQRALPELERLRKTEQSMADLVAELDDVPGESNAEDFNYAANAATCTALISDIEATLPTEEPGGEP